MRCRHVQPGECLVGEPRLQPTAVCVPSSTASHASSPSAARPLCTQAPLQRGSRWPPSAPPAGQRRAAARRPGLRFLAGLAQLLARACMVLPSQCIRHHSCANSSLSAPSPPHQLLKRFWVVCQQGAHHQAPHGVGHNIHAGAAAASRGAAQRTEQRLCGQAAALRVADGHRRGKPLPWEDRSVLL